MFATAPPLVMTNWLAAPATPINKLLRLLQTEPLSVTNTVLLLLLVASPKLPNRSLETTPPLVMVNWLPAPVLPTFRSMVLLQTEPLPLTNAVTLLLEVVNATKPLLIIFTAPPLRMLKRPSTCTMELLTSNAPPLLMIHALTTR